MKTKIGITFPLHDHADNQEGNVYFPYIAERNFTIKKGFKHEVYAQSAMSIRAMQIVRRTIPTSEKARPIVTRIIVVYWNGMTSMS